jgi:hypothetical protein
MIRTRVSASPAAARTRSALGICAATAGCVLSLTVAMPAAHADSLGDVRGRVNGARSTSPCPALNYSVELEGEAQARTGNTLPGVPPTGNYKGTFTAFVGNGDPAETAEVHTEVKADSAIKDCKYKDFGVGFFRPAGGDNDNVAIVLGQPAAPVAQPVPCPDGSTVPAGQTCPVKPAAAAPVPCPDGSTVPAGQTCPVAAAPVTNAITANYGTGGFTSIRLFVNNSSKLTGQCHYDATADTDNPLVPKDTQRDFKAPPGQSHLDFNGAITGTTYNATISCKDASGKQSEDIGDTTTSTTW